MHRILRIGPRAKSLFSRGIALGDQLLQLANVFAIAPPQTQMLIVGLAGIAAAAGPALLALGALTSALAMLVSPIGLVVAAVALLGVAWATNFGGIQDITAQMWATVQPIFQAMVERFNAVVAAFQTGSTSFAGIFGELGAALFGINTDVFDTTDSIREFVIALTGSVPAANGVDAAIRALSTVFAQMQTAWTQVVAFFAPLIANLATAFAGLPASMAPVLPALQGLLAAVQNMWATISPLLLMIGQVFTAIFAVEGVASINTFAAIVQNLGTIVTAVVNQMTLTINTIATIFREVGVLIQAIAAGDWTTAWNSVKNIVAAVGTQIIGTFENLKTLATGIFSAIKTAIVGALTSLGSMWPACWRRCKPDGIASGTACRKQSSRLPRPSMASKQSWMIL